MADQAMRSTGSSRKSWTKKRLLTLYDLRGAKHPPEDSLDAMAGRLSGFSEAVIDKACYALEGSVPGEYESRFPPIGTIEDACRAASRVAQEPAKFWMWECKRCEVVYASRGAKTNGCQNCGGALLLVSKPDEFDHAVYMRDVRQNPQNYVRVMREVIAKRRAEGKPVPPQFL